MKLELLPVDYKNLDEEEPHYKHILEDIEVISVIPSERLIRILVDTGDEALGVTDHAFYLLFRNSRTYYARSTLLSLLMSEHASRSHIVSSLVEHLRNSPETDKAYIPISLISESTPGYLFMTYHEGETLSYALASHGKQLNALQPTYCEDFEFSEDELNLIYAMHRKFCTASELIGEKCLFGIAEVNSEQVVCVRIGKQGFVLQRTVVSAVE